MRQLRAWVQRFAGLFDRRKDRDFQDEVESHLAMHIDDNLRAGMTPIEARRAALLALGGVEQVKEEYRDRRGIPFVEHLVHDVRFGARMLRKNPTFSLVGVLILGLGIGGNTALFSVINAVLLRPLPFPDAGRLVLIWATSSKTQDTQDVATHPDFEDWKAQSHSFESMAAFTTRAVTLSGGDQAELAPAVQVTPGFFETLGVSPSLGRTFRQDEQEAAGARVAVLSDQAWKQQFAGRADVLGQMIVVNDAPHTIVGVMPAGFRFSPDTPERLFLPIVRDPSRNHGFLRVLGRLRAGVNLSAAQGEMDAITKRLEAQYPRTNQGVGANVMPLVAAMVGDVRTGLLILVGVVALVLLIACTNVANLMLARDASRQRELAVRRALGAGRARLIQQLLTESTLLALAGGALGLLVAHWSTSVLVALLAKSFPIPRLENTQIDGWVLGFTLVLSVASGLLFGVMPAVAAASPGMTEGLSESQRTVAGSGRGRRVRRILLVAETALALVLLAGAGLLMKSLIILRGTPPGFDPENVMVVDFSLPKKQAASPIARTAFVRDLVSRVTTLPGVRSAALVANLPMNRGSDSLGFTIPGRPGPTPGRSFSANFNIVSEHYFRTMAIPVRSGREFTAQDSASTPGVIVINETAAQRFWPGEGAVGRQIILPGAKGVAVTLTVVGVVGDVRQMGLGEAARPEIFLNALQPGPGWPWLTLVIRAASDPMPLAGLIKSVARSVNSDVPIARMRTMDGILAESLAQPAAYTLLLGVFAGLALVLAAVGLYGVVSYRVTERSREMGIRLALGAERGEVLRLVLREGLGLTLTGIAIGLAGALAATRLLTHLIPQVEPGDPLTLSAVAILLLGVALAASFVPARRGSLVDPAVTLRYE